MNIYDIFMYPLEAFHLKSLRKQLIPKAWGEVLEIGAGTWVNFKYYDKSKIKSITVADKIISKTARKKGTNNVRFIECDVTRLPFEDNSFDTVIETLLLCSVDMEKKALREIYRVLKPDGIFVHIDHGLPKKESTRKIFNFAAPAWRACTKSCRINKDMKTLISKNNFNAEVELESGDGIFYGGVSIKEEE